MNHRWIQICTALALLTSSIALGDDKAMSAPPQLPDDIDFILSTATTSPTTRPATAPTTAPATPFGTRSNALGERVATFTYSDGSTFTGRVTTTLDKPLRIWVPEQGEFIDVPFANVRSAVAEVLWERVDKEYQFLVSGSDVKTYTGKTYPARETAYAFTLKDGRTVKGSIVAPFDVRRDNGEERLIVLHKRDKGPTGKTLNDLVYVTRMELSD